MSYSKPPKSAIDPENQLFTEKAPPCPKSAFLSLKPSRRFIRGLLILSAEPKIPQPRPAVISKLPYLFVPTMYSEENNPVNLKTPVEGLQGP